LQLEGWLYLIGLGAGRGQILHTHGYPPPLFPPQSVDSLLKFGYWEEFTGDENLVLGSLPIASQRATGNPTHEQW